MPVWLLLSEVVENRTIYLFIAMIATRDRVRMARFQVALGGVITWSSALYAVEKLQA